MYHIRRRTVGVREQRREKTGTAQEWRQGNNGKCTGVSERRELHGYDGKRTGMTGNSSRERRESHKKRMGMMGIARVWRESREWRESHGCDGNARKWRETHGMNGNAASDKSHTREKWDCTCFNPAVVFATSFWQLRWEMYARSSTSTFV